MQNADALTGSAANVASLLQEIEDEGIGVENDVCHAALRALAVHPDPVLRAQVLDTMRQSWHALSNVGWHDSVACLLKNEQLEEALEALDDMRQANVPIKGWLLDTIVYMLCDVGDFFEALQIMQDRIRSGELHISGSAWYHLLDGACGALHYDTLAFVWSRQIELQYLKPSNGQCLAILQAAAQAGDVALATNVFRELSNRGATLISQHYELLMDAYFATDDLKTPLTILCIMNSAGIKVSRRTTRSLYQTLSFGPQRTQQAFEALKELREEKAERAIPTAAIDAIIEATLDYQPSDAKRDERYSSNDANLATAIQRYKHLHDLCPAGPTLDTFNTLLSGCAATPGHKATAMFLASEMLYLRVQPNAATYDHLLVVCLNHNAGNAKGMGDDEYEDAFKYYQEMRERTWTPRPSTFQRMIKRCAEVGDQRAWVLIERMREAGIDIDGIRSWLNTNWTSS